MKPEIFRRIGIKGISRFSVGIVIAFRSEKSLSRFQQWPIAVFLFQLFVLYWKSLLLLRSGAVASSDSFGDSGRRCLPLVGERVCSLVLGDRVSIGRDAFGSKASGAEGFVFLQARECDKGQLGK